MIQKVINFLYKSRILNLYYFFYIKYYKYRYICYTMNFLYGLIYLSIKINK